MSTETIIIMSLGILCGCSILSAATLIMILHRVEQILVVLQ